MSLYGVIGYHVTLSEGHMIANHTIYLFIYLFIWLPVKNMQKWYIINIIIIFWTW